MPFAVVALIVTVALARGGYSASGMLVFELGAFALLLWAVVETLWGTSSEERAYHRAQPRGQRSGVEILPPGQSAVSTTRKSREHYVFVSGFPFKKTWLGWPLALLTAWIALSLVPISGNWLALLSPEAHALRVEAAGMTVPPTRLDAAPSSLAPFLTLRSLWLFCACASLIFVGAHMASRARRAERLSQLLFLAGVGFGLYGLGQWLFGLQELLGREATGVHFRASGSFGNRNHYAAFMEMLLLCGLGWVGMRRAGFHARSGGSFARRIEAGGGKLFFLGLGVVFTSLGLIFSLSRSGITFGLLGCALLILMRPAPRSADAGIELSGSVARRQRSLAGVWAMVLLVVGTAAWIGLDPVAHRFKVLPNEWDAERDRVHVWSDAIGAVPDFALTGSGLSTFRYVFPRYRSFGGSTFYSWAHNDYLQVLIELGVPGLLLVLWIMAAVWHRSKRVRVSLREDPALLHLHTGYVAAAIAVALHSFTDFGLHLMANAALFSVILGVMMGLQESTSTETRAH